LEYEIKQGYKNGNYPIKLRKFEGWTICSLIVIDIETFKMGLKELGKLEHYEDCSLMVKHIDKFVIDEEIYFKLYKQVLGITSHINI